MGLGDRWSIGGTAKAIRQSIASYSGTGAGLDLGLGYKANRRVRLGLAVRNALEPSIKLRNTSEEHPREIRAGVGFLPIGQLLVAVDVSAISGESLQPSLGAEWKATPLFAIRGGLTRNEFSAGAGVILGDWGLDYAFGYHPAESAVSGLDASHRLGLHLNFGPEMTAAGALMVKRSSEEEAARRKKEAKEQLLALRKLMDAPSTDPRDERKAVREEARRSLHAGLYPEPSEASEIQGYLAFFDGRLQPSVESLEKAVALRPTDKALKKRLVHVRTRMSAAARPPSTPEIRRLRELYDKKDWVGAIGAAERILNVSPGNQEAADILKQSLANILEPQLTSARENLEKEKYVDAFIDYQKVLDLDPENKQALSQVARVSKVIEWKADMESATRKRPRTDRLQKCLRHHREALRFYSTGQWKKARASWENALLYTDNNSLAEDAIKSALVELGRLSKNGES